MDFFKSIFSAEPDPEPSEPLRNSQSPSGSPRDPPNEEGDIEQEEEADAASGNSNSSPLSVGGGAWKFGELIKTIASKSESVIQTYKHDLEEFGTELKKETSVFKEVASRAVRDFPGSLDVGASVAQESLESVGEVIDEFGGTLWRGTAVIISQGKEALLSLDSDSSSPDGHSSEASSQIANSAPPRYNRFEAQVLAIQNDGNTFVEAPEDGEDFEKWRGEFKLEEKEEEIEGLLYENGNLEGFFEKFVPEVVDRETFWSRYFYRVYRLKLAEDARAKLVQKAISGEEEEELSWEVDDNDEEETKGVVKETEEGEKVTEKEVLGTSELNEEKKAVEEAEEAEKEEIIETAERPDGEAVETSERPKGEVVKEIVGTLKSEEEKKSRETTCNDNVQEAEKVNSNNSDDSALKTEDKMPSEPKSEPRKLGKDSNFSVVSGQPSGQEEDDLGWDEIADLGEHEDKVAGRGGSPKRVDLRKSLTVTEDDEDLSWDIEDDDDEAPKA